MSNFYPDDFFDALSLLRAGERVFLILFVTTATTVLMLVFRKGVQKIQVNAEKFSTAVAATLAAPIFLLLAYIGFVWIVFDSPITVTGQIIDNGGGKTFSGSNTERSATEKGLLLSSLAANMSTLQLIEEYRKKKDEAILGEIAKIASMPASKAPSAISDALDRKGFSPAQVFPCLPSPLHPTGNSGAECEEINEFFK